MVEMASLALISERRRTLGNIALKSLAETKSELLENELYNDFSLH